MFATLRIVVFLVLSLVVFDTARALAQAPATRSLKEDISSMTARVERVDPATRSVTLKTAQGLSETIVLGPGLTTFDNLKSGDTVQLRFTASVDAVVKSGARPQTGTDTTAAAQRTNQSAAADVLEQSKTTIKVESVDLSKKMIVYQTADNRLITRQVSDAKLIDGLKYGDVVELTVTRERTLEKK